MPFHLAILDTDDLGTLGGGQCDPSQAYRINDAGEVAGCAGGPAGCNSVFLYSNGQMQRLPTLPRGDRYALAYGINNSSHVVGTSSNLSGDYHAVLWENGAIADLGANSSTAFGINNEGQVVGETGLPRRPFIWDPITKTMQVLENPFGDNVGRSRAYAINEDGLVVGFGEEDAFRITHTHSSTTRAQASSPGSQRGLTAAPIASTTTVK